MNVRRLGLVFLCVLACSRSPEDAGIVLNVDTDVTSDRAAIDHITVTVDGQAQEWILKQPLPGSLGIETSPGNKSVEVQGFSKTVLRGSWSSRIVANKGKVVVQDVHLSSVPNASVDAGTASFDGGARDGALDVGADSVNSSVDSADVLGMDGAGGVLGRDGSLGKDAALGSLDGSAGDTTGADGTGDVLGRDSSLDSGGDYVSDGGLASDGPLMPTALLAGAFSVSSQFQVPATVATPGALGDTLRLVHGLVDDPGTAILQFADDAGVQELATLRAVLPDALESRLPDWMNSYLKTATVNGVSPYDRFVTLDTIIQSLLLNWELQSRLALPLDGPGTHTPIALVFVSPLGPVPLDPTAAVTPGVGVTANVSWPSGPDAAAVATLSDHTMGLPFGRYALQALHAILLTEYGADSVGAYLTNAVDCSALAQDVASRCFSMVCVGHATELVAICEGGLSEGGNQIENQVLSLDFKAIHFERGSAIAVGSTVLRPQNATSLESGTWASTIDFGDGPQPATATFTAAAEVGSL